MLSHCRAHILHVGLPPVEIDAEFFDSYCVIINYIGSKSIMF